jgi:YVTN family beta-propeller protein
VGIVHPYGIAVNGDGSRVYVANNSAQGSLIVVDTARNNVADTIAVGNNPVQEDGVSRDRAAG